MNFAEMRLPGFRRTDVLKVFADHGTEPKGESKDELIDELEALEAAGKFSIVAKNRADKSKPKK